MINENRKIENIEFKNMYTLEKMEDIFIDVIFNYEESKWHGALPIYMLYQGFEIKTDSELNAFAINVYKYLNPKTKNEWNSEKDSYWSSLKKGPTYNVLEALNSGDWECRVCGPVPLANPQPSARLRDLKKMGYTIASKRTYCSKCDKKTMHDILIKIRRIDIEDSAKGRETISKKLRARIISILKNKEVCFNVTRTNKELVVDHKFPSQRWDKTESKNPDEMTEAQIINKFQLLSNQTNLWKSRFCDRCVKEGIRGDFMGINWFYTGNSNWEGKTKSDEKGCVGCPWYDLEKWKIELMKTFK